MMGLNNAFRQRAGFAALLFVAGVMLILACSAKAQSEAPAPPRVATDGLPTNTWRLYDGLTAFIFNDGGDSFRLTLQVRDINHAARGPAELLVKLYRPDGSVAVREVVPDDGVVANTFTPPVAGYDHESWYFATTWLQGLYPAVRFSAWTDPARVAAMPVRTFTYDIDANLPGVYRAVLVGQGDHIISLDAQAGDTALPLGVSGSPDFLVGSGDQYRKAYICVPPGAQGITAAVLEMDYPFSRSITLRNLKGEVLLEADGAEGYVRRSLKFDDPAAMAGQVLVVQLEAGANDCLFSVHFDMDRGNRYGKPGGRLFTVLCPDEAVARAIGNGAIEHDGRTYFQPYNVRLHDYLASLPDEAFVIPDDVKPNPQPLVSTGSHQSPGKGTADRLMHDYAFNKDPHTLNAAIRDMHEGLARIGHDDHVMRGYNLAYEMGSYSFFYHRPAWRIIQHSDAPSQVKEALHDFVIQTGDRLAFARGVALINGNSLASLISNLRYCVEATQDPLQRELFETYWQRFTTGGFHERIGVGPSGGVQEGFGYDYHYGSYIFRGWKAVIADIGDPRFEQVLNDLRELYSYTYIPEVNAGGPWSSRTAAKLPSNTYDPWEKPYRYKGYDSEDFTASVRDADEWFAARRRGYYAVTYHGRITPMNVGYGAQGQIGYGGGMLCQLHVSGKGPVIVSRLRGDYGSGMNPAMWRNFTIHTVAGVTGDDRPFVSANSEHYDAKLQGQTVSSSGHARGSSVDVARRYTFNEDHVECEVSLRRSSLEKVFVIWGGMPALRDRLNEAWEIIPTLGFKVGKEKMRAPADRVELMAFGAAGDELGAVSEDQAITAKRITLDRGGFGVHIDLDQPRPVKRGRQGALLIQLIDGPTVLEEIQATYTLTPF